MNENYDQNISGLYMFRIRNWEQNGEEVTFNKGTDGESKGTIKSMSSKSLVLEATETALGVTNTYTISMSK